jgi:hypothetical protein
MNMMITDSTETRNQETFTTQTADFLAESGFSLSEILSLNEPPLPFENAGFRPPDPDVADAESSPRSLDYSWQEPLARLVAGWLRA